MPVGERRNAQPIIPTGLDDDDDDEGNNETDEKNKKKQQHAHGSFFD